jgi:2-oxoglutarate ferredoxin oxidoreductase subunit alpha
VSQEAPPRDEADVEEIASVRIRFAGDSGDGMQLVGARFTEASAIFGNDLSTFPSYPAEIRAPADTLGGVSSFQVHIADRDILTPGDHPDVLVAMNPAALKANLDDLQPAGTIIVNTDAFTERRWTKAGYDTDPLKDGTLDGYSVLPVPMEDLTKKAVEGTGLKGRGVLRSKNFLALGVLAWMYNRPIESTMEWIEKKFGSTPEVHAANVNAFKAGYNLGITTEVFRHSYEVKPAEMDPGTYTNVTGNQAVAWGIIAAGQAAKLSVFYASYPITPASDILHELARHRNYGVRTYQAEDEIAAAGAALGASFAGHFAVTGTSGPGVALKSETISLTLMSSPTSSWPSTAATASPRSRWLRSGRPRMPSRRPSKRLASPSST